MKLRRPIMPALALQDYLGNLAALLRTEIELFQVCPLGLRAEPASIAGIDLHGENGSLSRHDHMLLLDALEAALAETAADPSSWPKPALAHYSHTP